MPVRFLLINVKLILANNAHYLVLGKGLVPAAIAVAPEEMQLSSTGIWAWGGNVLGSVGVGLAPCMKTLLEFHVLDSWPNTES